ncbi:MAG: DUF1365 domain-containing protein [Solirubrobacteraceae bacterium]
MSLACASAIYEGIVRHRRYAVAPTEFTHRIAFLYLALDELSDLLGGRLLSSRPGLVRFCRADYHGPAERELADAVRDTVQAQSGTRPAGPITLLTQLRTLGRCFNPVSFYYCMDADGEHLQSVLAEVTNTPWGERRAYVLHGRRPGSPIVTAEFGKDLHVSPFMGMAHRYRARAGTPGDTLSVHIESWAGATLDFDATLSLRRGALTERSLARNIARYPFGSWRALALIYGHAARLKLAGVPYFPHPARGRA